MQNRNFRIFWEDNRRLWSVKTTQLSIPQNRKTNNKLINLISQRGKGNQQKQEE